MNSSRSNNDSRRATVVRDTYGPVPRCVVFILVSANAHSKRELSAERKRIDLFADIPVVAALIWPPDIPQSALLRFLNQSKNKQHNSFPALDAAVYMYSSRVSGWFVVLFASVAIDQSNYISFGSTILD